METGRILARHWIPVLVWMGVVGILSVVRVPDVEVWSGADKVIHLALYAGLGFFAARAWSVGRTAGKGVALAVATGFVFGAFLEWVQGHVGRGASGGDLIADVIGAAIGALTRWRLDAWRGSPTVESSR